MKNGRHIKPPALAQRLFYWYCSDPLKEEIAGDLEERFLDHLEREGLASARRKYWLNVMKFFRWHTLKRRGSKTHTQNNISMFKNYFKIAFRSALKHKAYTFINLTGLAVGLTSFIMILLYVQHQLSFDQFHQNKDRIFRVHDGVNAITANIVGPFIQRNFTDEVDEVVRTIYMGSQFFLVNEESFSHEVLYTDPGLFKVFSFPLIHGDSSRVLTDPNSMVVSQSAALKYFGKTDILGESFEMEGKQYRVAGVMADIPKNSSMNFEFAVPLYDLSWAKRETWSNRSYFTFLKLPQGVDADALAAKVVEKVNGQFGTPPAGENSASAYLQPLTDIYLQRNWKLDYENGRMGDITYVYIFSAVAGLILLIACVNYVNLATSRSLERAREVGIRKVVGAYRGQLIMQFLSESLLFVFGALVLSLGLSYGLLPYFEQLSGVVILPARLFELNFLLKLAGLGVLIAMLAGFYPALMLSMFKPVLVLKGSFKNSASGSRLRKVLVIFQFAISAFLLVATLVVNKQLNYIQNKKLGFDREHLLYFVIDSEVRKSREVLKDQLLANSYIDGVTFTSHIPVSIGSANGIQTGPEEEDWELIYFMYADKDAMEVMGMNLLEGRGLDELAVPFSELDSSGRKPSYILNEAAIALFNWSPEEAVGQNVKVSGLEAPVQGVVENFHFKSMQQEVEPFIILNNPDRYYYGTVKVSGENLAETIDFIGEKVKAIAPKIPFDYTFMDDRFDRMYRMESQLSDVFLTFAFIAIVIACLGMFGLISFMALNRAREFGIRKVLGASVSTIVLLLSRDFLKLVLISLLVALPLGYYFMSGWLQDYAYAVEIGPDVALLAVLFAFSVTMITIGYQALKTALLNPARVLRNE